ncbi:phosphatase PAP2 family protein [Rickettsia endosymbiont of Halotydeus destructor]|uniref:phosphatase PAP2 family protein n=1 Tax=Rickettsia endosymbiont of Halotydeus destructor TaxID=2996754 RepID=UPI003BAEDC6B
MINNRLVYISMFISGTILIILILFPQLDIDFSKFFYHTNNGFIYKNTAVVRFLFLSIPILTKAIVIISLLSAFYYFIKYRKSIFLSWSFYILITVAIGPGLIVNYALKENFGRARPAQIENFGGEKDFTGALLITNQCDSNCSFSSGHAAMGYYFTSLAYILPHIYFSWVYITALLFGSLVGFSRILMGGHFISDVTASCFIILLVNHVLYLVWLKFSMSFPRKRESRKIFSSHPEFISGSTKKMLKQVQHDKERSGFPPARE